MGVSPELRKLIADDLIANKTIREIAEARKVDKGTVSRVRAGIKHLIQKDVSQSVRKKPQTSQVKVNRKKTGQETTKKQTEKADKSSVQSADNAPPRAGMVRGATGGWINNGPGLGRTKGSRSTTTALLEFLVSENETSGRTWGEDVMRSLCIRAMSGNAEYMSMLLTLVHKGDERLKIVDPEIAEATKDPLFDNMSLADLEAEIFLSLKSKFEVIDVEAADIQEEA